MNETTKEVAKAVSKTTDLADKMGSFMGKFISGPIEQMMGIWEDKLKYRRWETQISLIEKASKKMVELGIEPNRPIPMKIAIPLLEYASIEEAEDLQNLWANLLVNCGNSDSGIKQEISYVEILKSLSSLEAKILQTVYALPFEEALHNGVLTENLPDHAELLPEKGKADIERKNPSSDVISALANLDRLGCINVTRSMGGGQLFFSLNATLLGRKFVEACTIMKNHE